MDPYEWANKLTAVEMADELEKGPLIPRDSAAKMIRRQADLIKQASQFIQEQGLERQWIVWSTLKKASDK